CLGLAILSVVYNTLFLYGMKSFDIASGAFTFCMTVVVLPVVLLTMHRKIELKTWLSVLFVCTGIVLALGGRLQGGQLPGLGVMGVGCLLRAVFIVLLADFAKKHDPLAIAIFLELFASVYAFFGWLCDEPRLFLALPYSRTLIASWAIYSYFIVAISQALNTFAMKRVTAANATIVYSTEIVFTLIWGMILPESVIEHIKMTPFILLGAVLVIIGSLAEIIEFPQKTRDGKVDEKEGTT
ncbi:MAG: DMT family transporter, partial [Victivallales bacterium]|nr:DMT family transporter [Victivallales bacterium]